MLSNSKKKTSLKNIHDQFLSKKKNISVDRGTVCIKTLKGTSSGFIDVYNNLGLCALREAKESLARSGAL
jgi:hypothetical protein